MKAIQRTLLPLVLAMLVAGCQSSTEAIGENVRGLLQKKLDTTFGRGSVSVLDVIVVHDEGNRYQGDASLSAFSHPMALKLEILADDRNVIYEPMPPGWAAFIAAVNRQKVAAVEGKYSNVVVENDIVFSCFPELLRRDKGKFAERLSTVGPVQAIGNFWFGSGCKAHECGSEEAAWAIDRDEAKGYAVILTEGVHGRPTFSIYGGEPEQLPRPLLYWAVENGMNAFNSVHIRSRDP